MSAEIHSETELYRLESRPARKLVWIEAIATVATRLWRVYHRTAARDGGYIRARTLGSTRAPRVVSGALAGNSSKSTIQCEQTPPIGEGANRCTRGRVRSPEIPLQL